MSCIDEVNEINVHNFVQYTCCLPLLCIVYDMLRELIKQLDSNRLLSFPFFIISKLGQISQMSHLHVTNIS
jgi:hypothetical protein